MRGIAALAVATHHGTSAFAGGSTPRPLDWLLFAFNPAVSVMFFFVLSGYVLGRALDRDGKISPFLVRRAFASFRPSSLRAVRLCLRDPDSDWFDTAGADGVFHEKVSA
jgi:hypothetical protein